MDILSGTEIKKNLKWKSQYLYAPQHTQAILLGYLCQTLSGTTTACPLLFAWMAPPTPSL